MAKCAICGDKPLYWHNGDVRTFWVNIHGPVPLCRRCAVVRNELKGEYTAAEALWLASRKVPMKRRIEIVMSKEPPVEQKREVKHGPRRRQVPAL